MEGLVIEAVYSNGTMTVSSNLSSFVIRKCKFGNFVTENNAHLKNGVIDQCRINATISLYYDDSENLQIKNSIINTLSYALSEAASILVENCIITGSVDKTFIALLTQLAD